MISNKCGLNGPLPETTTNDELYDYFIKNIYYGVESTNMNNHKIFEMICENKDNNSPVKYYSGLKKNECLILLSEFFTRKR